MEETSIDALSFDFWMIIEPALALLFVGVVGVVFFNIVQSIAKGIIFKIISEFSVGDNVIIDGEPGIIAHIGLFQTKILLNGEGLRWKYISNQRVTMHDFQKVLKIKEKEK